VKKIVLTILLVTLLLVEVFLLSTFLPMRWQLAMQHLLPETHDQADITHPELAHEIDEVFRTHPAIATMYYAFLIFLLAANAALIFVVWKNLRRMRNA
jgi:hypothetical protein